MRRLLLVLIVLLVVGCQPKRKEFPVLTYDTPTLVALSASAHANDIGGYAKYVMPTGSMRPTIQDYDWVVVSNPAKDPFSNIQEGDIVLYAATWTPQGSLPVLHRAAQKDSDGWIMSGDNNAHYESRWRVTEANYLGRLVAIYRLEQPKSPSSATSR